MGTDTNNTGLYASGCRVRDSVYTLAALGGLQLAKDARHMLSVGRAERISEQPGTYTTEKGQSVESVVRCDWLFGHMSPRPVLTVPTTNAVPANQRINAPTPACIDTAATSPLSRAVFITPEMGP